MGGLILYYVFSMFASKQEGYLDEKRTVTAQFEEYRDAKNAYRHFSKQIKAWKRLDPSHIGRCTLIVAPSQSDQSSESTKPRDLLGQQSKLLAERN
ncbi:MAG TPA: hypothetical protein PLB79_05265 [Thermotogota bacterium]|nr:hypothetical protein [Thermotogota bacterium]NLH20139.1 hypothetical protein [Thermotogaceae bacterium]OQC32785.1 MAG: hypothetical protein BWX67_00115 [Thermotogota bacterium ADurb.Bin062]HNW46621.1 hypothetical protein [Thermotogota bacterium]HNY81689.1 hypothetical protein [Thermotogota bacterium]